MEQRGVTDDQQESQARQQDITSAPEPTASISFAPIAYVKAATIGGLVAAVVFIIYYVVANSAFDVVRPFQFFASLLLGRDALHASAPISLVVPIGILDHVLISLFWGLVFGLLLACSGHEWAAGSIVAIGILYGAIVWLVDFHMLAPVFWPWIHSLSSVSQFLGHAFFFGLPLGVWVALKK